MIVKGVQALARERIRIAGLLFGVLSRPQPFADCGREDCWSVFDLTDVAIRQWCCRNVDIARPATPLGQAQRQSGSGHLVGASVAGPQRPKFPCCFGIFAISVHRFSYPNRRSTTQGEFAMEVVVREAPGVGIGTAHSPSGYSSRLHLGHRLAIWEWTDVLKS